MKKKSQEKEKGHHPGNAAMYCPTCAQRICTALDNLTNHGKEKDKLVIKHGSGIGIFLGPEPRFPLLRSCYAQPRLQALLLRPLLSALGKLPPAPGPLLGAPAPAAPIHLFYQ